jgi:hypothetical protein
LLGALVVESVDVSCVQRLAAPATLSLVASTRLVCPSMPSMAAAWPTRQLTLEALDLLPAATSTIHVGSYVTVALPVADTLNVLIEREHRQRLISCDLNVRLNVESSLDYWRTKFEWMVTRTHLLKVSEVVKRT